MRIKLPVAGIFEVGKITFWRDYCDMQTLTNQMTGSSTATELRRVSRSGVAAQKQGV